MADRFCGTIVFGGQIKQSLHKKLEELCQPLGDDGMDADDTCFFHDCTSGDFKELKEFCQGNGIALMIQWDAKYEYDGQIEYFIDGRHSEYWATNSGNIVFRLADIEKHLDMSIKDYIESMNIPEFPDLEIIDDQESQHHEGNH